MAINSFGLFISEMPSSYFFFKKKKIQKKEENAKQGGRPAHREWFGHPSIYLYIFLVFSSLFFFGFFFFKKKNVMGAFRE
jgi:hypothetical protein